MPVGERLSSSAQTISAGARKPVEPIYTGTIKPHAISDALHSMLIIETTAIAPIKKPACDVRRVEKTGFFIFKFVDATTAAAVAQSFPLSSVQACKRFLPK